MKEKRIKILFTIPNFDTAGSGKALLNIAIRLDKTKFESQVACLHNRGDYFQEVKKSGIKIHLIDLYKNARPISKMLYECSNLSRIFKKISPDIIHSYHYAADYTEPLAARMAGVKWIYTKKNMSWEGPSYRGWKLRSWLADGIICQNSDMLKIFFPDWNKANLIPIGVDINKYKKKHVNIKIKKQLGIPDYARIIISVANLIPVKGIEILIKAFKQLSLENTSWRLMIVGDTSTKYGAKLKNEISIKSNLENKIIFTGKQRNIRELLDIAEIYVQPSLYKGEGAPIAILEAMANSKVIIGSDVPGIRDQLKFFPDHLFPAGDIDSLIKKLELFMRKSTSENYELGKSFYQYVLNNYDISNEKVKIQKYYKQILQG